MSGVVAGDQLSGLAAPRELSRPARPSWNIAKRAKGAVKSVTISWRRSLLRCTPASVQRWLAPATSYLDMLLVDHGIFRLLYLNRHRLGASAWRSAQPAPHDIGALARKGLRTVINMRGERLCGSYWLERAACERHGVALLNLPIRSRRAPSREELRTAREMLEFAEYPILIHCKSGADRAGLMSALYRHVKEGVPVASARYELSIRYGHFRHADTGILDHVFERYIEDDGREPIDFFDWVESKYDPAEITASFRANRHASRFVSQVLKRE